VVRWKSRQVPVRPTVVVSALEVPLDFNALSDVELMRLLREDREEALRVLVERHQQNLVNFFRRLGADVHEAQDGAQETFLRLFRYRDRYRPTAPFRSFLYTLARHAWVDATRRSERQRAVPLGGREDIPGELDVRRDGHLNLEDRLDLEQALEELPEHLRWTIVLSVHQGLSYGEIAEVLQIPVGTVKSRIFYAIRRLREALHARLDP
jgi:RNA polymerase sigma-70 factor (ECF subfamily)